MEYFVTKDIPYEEIENGALLLLLLRECRTWEELCGRYVDVSPTIPFNTNTMCLRDKLFEMRELGLVKFQEEETAYGKQPTGEIIETELLRKIAVAFGGMSLTETAMVSRHSRGMAVVPVYGRPKPLPPGQSIDVFVLMPFKAKLDVVYTRHIKKLCEEMGVSIRRADEDYTTQPFMEKVWCGICAAQLILADCTEKNPNVFYEVGMAHTVGKRVILITRSEKDIPSDIKHFDYISYTEPEGVVGLIEKLRTFLLKQQFKG